MSRQTDRFVQQAPVITLTEGNKKKINEIREKADETNKDECRKLLESERKNNKKLNRVWRECDNGQDMYDVAKTVYTYEDYEKPPLYEDFNAACRDLMQNKVQWNGFQYKGLFVALHHSFSKKADLDRADVYRLVRAEVKAKKNEIISFQQFASTSRSREVAQNFGHGQGGTLFYIKQAEGLDLKSYSCYPGEEEIVLHPFAQFEVEETYGPKEGWCFIVLRQI